MKYAKSSPQRWSFLKQYCENEDITCKSHVCLYVQTWWNSAYMILDRAKIFRKKFKWLENKDLRYRKSLGEEDSETNDGGLVSKLDPPNKDDWDKSTLLVKFLKLFL